MPDKENNATLIITELFVRRGGVSLATLRISRMDKEQNGANAASASQASADEQDIFSEVDSDKNIIFMDKAGEYNIAI